MKGSWNSIKVYIEEKVKMAAKTRANDFATNFRLFLSQTVPTIDQNFNWQNLTRMMVEK
jgi:hypothetical protein